MKKSKTAKKKEIDKAQTQPYIDAEQKLPQLTEAEAGIVEILRRDVTLVDEIIAQAQAPAGAVLAALTMLEVKGVITRLPGKRVALKKGK